MLNSTTILTLVIFLILLSIVSSFFSQKKKSYLLKLGIIYDRMELSLVKNKIAIDSDIKKYLIGHKNYIVNNELIDIQVLLAIGRLIPKEVMQQMKEQNRKIKLSLPQETIKLEEEFELLFYKLIFLSTLRPTFLIFVFAVMVKKIFTSKRAFNSIVSIKGKLHKLASQENVIGRYSINNKSVLTA